MDKNEAPQKPCAHELEVARAAVDSLLKTAYAEAEQNGTKVGAQARAWWTNHYEKSFLYALVAKGMTEDNLKEDDKILRALAKVLGRSARGHASSEGKKEISDEHAKRASDAVDCSLTRDDRPSIRQEWCN